MPKPAAVARRQLISPSRRRTWLLAGLSVLVTLAAIIVAAEITLRFLPVRSALLALPVNAENPVMRFAPNRRFTYSMGWDLANVVRGWVNNYGFVNDQDYDSSLVTPLLAVIGDSYVEALMIEYQETLQGRLAEVVGSSGRVYSLGMSGATLAQYLAMTDFARTTFRPSALIVVIVGNDFDESLLKYRRARGYHYFTEDSSGPRLGRVDYTPRPLARVVRYSALARYVLHHLGVLGAVAGFRARLRNAEARPVQYVGNTVAAADSQRLADSRRVVDAFLAQLPARAGLDPSRILLVLDGIRPNLYDGEALRQAEGTYFDLMRRYVLQAATTGGFEVVDMQQRFIERHRRDGALFEFPRDGHWNAVGHEEAAAAVAGTATFRRVFRGPGPVR